MHHVTIYCTICLLKFSTLKQFSFPPRDKTISHSFCFEVLSNSLFMYTTINLCRDFNQCLFLWTATFSMLFCTCWPLFLCWRLTVKTLGWFVTHFIIHKLLPSKPSERKAPNSSENQHPSISLESSNLSPTHFLQGLGLAYKSAHALLLGPRELPLANWIQPLALLWMASRYTIPLRSIQQLPTALLHFGPKHWHP